MRLNRVLSGLLVTTLLVASQFSTVSAEEKASTFSEVVSKVLDLQGSCNGLPIVAIFDLDNVIIKTPQFLGSEEWFKWQLSLLEVRDSVSKSQSVPPEILKNLIVSDYAQLLDRYQLFARASRQILVEPSHVESLTKLQASGVQVLALTARGPVDREYTLRELKSLKVLPFSNPAKLADGAPTVFVPSGMKRAVEYVEGIILTEGQNKGEVLKAVMPDVAERYCGILYVDNQARQLARVSKVFPKAKTVLYTFTADLTAPYEVVDRNSSSIADEVDQLQVIQSLPRTQEGIADWNTLKNALESVFQSK